MITSRSTIFTIFSVHLHTSKQTLRGSALVREHLGLSLANHNFTVRDVMKKMSACSTCNKYLTCKQSLDTCTHHGLLLRMKSPHIHKLVDNVEVAVVHSKVEGTPAKLH